MTKRYLAQQSFLDINQNLYDEYEMIERNYEMSELKKAFWIEGREDLSKALFLAHGYMGSPNEMLLLAQPFIEAGWTVIGFLIPGHGSSSTIANQYNQSRWRFELQRQLSLVLETFDDVRAVGFSTGGLLLQDFIRQAPPPPSLSGLHLISPFFLQRIGSFLNIFDGLFEKIFDHVTVERALAFTGFPDLLVMTRDLESYNRTIPLGVAHSIKALGKEVFKAQAPVVKRQIPVQLFLSENDWTVKIEASRFVIYRDTEAHKIELITFAGKEPHHLMAPMVSGVALEIQKKIYSKSTYGA